MFCQVKRLTEEQKEAISQLSRPSQLDPKDRVARCESCLHACMQERKCLMSAMDRAFASQGGDAEYVPCIDARRPRNDTGFGAEIQ